MTHRSAAWYRDAEAKRPLMKVTCNRDGCDFCVPSTNPEMTKAAHAGDRHYGQPWDFSVTKWPQTEEAKQ